MLRRAILPLTATVLFACCAFESCAFAAWPAVSRHPPFVVHANFDLRPFKPLFEELSRLQLEISQQLKTEPAEEQIDVYLFDTEATYRSYMRRYFPGVTPRRAMFIKTRGPGNVFAFRSKELAVDLRHESTHAILHASLPMVPLWLDEGLAEYFEIPAPRRSAQHPYFKKVRWDSRWTCPSIARLEGITQLSDMGTSEYREAWSWVHFMLHGPAEAKHELHAYLQDIRDTEVPGELSRRLVTQIPEIRQAYAQHFRTRTR